MTTVKEFVCKSPSEAPGPAHPCDDPSLSPLQFLHAIYRDPTFPMSLRIDAARGLLPYTEPRPTNSFPRCKIVIGGLGPCDHESGAHSPDGINTISQSKSDFRVDNLQPSSGPVDPLNIETNSYPPTLIDYSKPPTPEEIQEIKTVVHQLCPDADLSQLPEPRLCACGHWTIFPCRPVRDSLN